MLFSKSTLIRQELSINPEINMPSYPGLYALLENPDFEFSSSSLFEEVDWSELSGKTVAICFLKLISEKLIKIEYVKSEVKALFKLINYQKDEFSISIVDKSMVHRDGYTDLVEDDLTHELYACIIFRSGRNSGKTELKRVIGFLKDRSIGSSDDDKPAKTFLTTVLKRYNSENWFHMVKYKRTRSLYNTYTFEIDTAFRSKLLNEHESFESITDSINDPNISTLCKQIQSHF